MYGLGVRYLPVYDDDSLAAHEYLAQSRGAAVRRAYFEILDAAERRAQRVGEQRIRVGENYLNFFHYGAPPAKSMLAYRNMTSSKGSDPAEGF